MDVSDRIVSVLYNKKETLLHREPMLLLQEIQ